MANEELWEEAEKLAGLPYVVTIEQETDDEAQITFVARNPELPGCISMGSSEDEAIRNLAEARKDYIYSLLEDGLRVPRPAKSSNPTT